MLKTHYHQPVLVAGDSRLGVVERQNCARPAVPYCGAWHSETHPMSSKSPGVATVLAKLRLQLSRLDLVAAPAWFGLELVVTTSQTTIV